jgi:hypothetical protein
MVFQPVTVMFPARKGEVYAGRGGQYEQIL